MTYDPHYAKPLPKPDHECQWVQARSRFFEVCTVPGCTLARVSRTWIARMQRPTVQPAPEQS